LTQCVSFQLEIQIKTSTNFNFCSSHILGKEKSLNSEKTYAAARLLKDDGTRIYTIGLNFRDSTELDVISSEPVDDHRSLVSGESQLQEVPGIYKYRIDRG
jgi:hypothetical protein